MSTQKGKQIVFARYPQPSFVRQFLVEYDFLPGFNRSIHQKNVRAIHKTACSWEEKQNTTKKYRILEISTASETELGRALSAFNLTVTLVCNGQRVTRTVEQWYQSSKVYQRGDGRDEYGRFDTLFNLPGGRLVMPPSKSKNDPIDLLELLTKTKIPRNQSKKDQDKAITQALREFVQTNIKKAEEEATKRVSNLKKDKQTKKAIKAAMLVEREKILRTWVTGLLKRTFDRSDDDIKKALKNIAKWNQQKIQSALRAWIGGDFYQAVSKNNKNRHGYDAC